MTEEKVDVQGGPKIIFRRCLFRVRTHGGRGGLDAAVLLQLHSAIGSVGSNHEVAWVERVKRHYSHPRPKDRSDGFPN